MEKKEQTIKAIKLLEKEYIDYEIKNNGIHLIVTSYKGTRIDFYPTTGKFIVKNGKDSVGLNNLIRYIKGER